MTFAPLESASTVVVSPAPAPTPAPMPVVTAPPAYPTASAAASPPAIPSAIGSSRVRTRPPHVADVAASTFDAAPPVATADPAIERVVPVEDADASVGFDASVLATVDAEAGLPEDAAIE
ncbi:MAG: hypothetical protein ABIP89_13715 [Polyangiaceae bacterium]